MHRKVSTTTVFPSGARERLEACSGLEASSAGFRWKQEVKEELPGQRHWRRMRQPQRDPPHAHLSPPRPYSRAPYTSCTTAMYLCSDQSGTQCPDIVSDYVTHHHRVHCPPELLCPTTCYLFVFALRDTICQTLVRSTVFVLNLHLTLLFQNVFFKTISVFHAFMYRS